MKDSSHSLIPFLPFILKYPANCQLRTLSQFLATTANSGTQLSSNSLLQLPLLMTSLHGAQLSTQF
jgi:hypothetical protein